MDGLSHEIVKMENTPSAPAESSVDGPNNEDLNEDNIKPEADSFYTDAAKYWSEIPPTVEGMLGGFGFVSHSDIQGSDSFITQIFKLKHPPKRTRALDCGAGIGRVTKLLLQRHFSTVDLVEQNPAFLTEARAYLGPSKKIGQLFCCGLQNFHPEQGAYDVIWVQWVLGHLTDQDFVNFMKSCVLGLRENGVIVVKENVTSSRVDEKDLQDSSVTRCEESLVSLLEGPAGLRIIRQMKQHKFPKGLYPVQMYALRCQKSPLIKQSAAASQVQLIRNGTESKEEIKTVEAPDDSLEVAMDTQQSNHVNGTENISSHNVNQTETLTNKICQLDQSKEAMDQSDINHTTDISPLTLSCDQASRVSDEIVNPQKSESVTPPHQDVM